MSTYINTNTTAYMASLNLNANTAHESTDIERLSTGLKINSAADDPAGLVTAESESAELSGLNQATANSNDAINLTQTAEGALNQVQVLLVSMRQLAVAASQTGTNNSSELAADQAQITSAIQSINNISSTTEFNNSNLLDGTANSLGTTSPGSAVIAGNTAGTTLVAQGSWPAALGANSITVTNATYSFQNATATGLSATADSFEGQISINGTNYNVGNVSGLNTTTATLAQVNQQLAGTGYQASITGGVFGVASTTPGAVASSISLSGLSSYAVTAQTALTTALTPTALVNSAVAVTGVNAGTNSYATVAGLGNSINEVASGSSTIYSFSNGMQIETATPTPAVVGVAAAASASLGTITGTAGVTTVGKALEFQTGANEGQNVSLNIASTAANQLGTGAAAYTNAAGVLTTPSTQNVAAINVGTFTGAQDAIAVLDQAITQISTIRADLGAFQTNVLQSNVTSLGVATQNLQSAQATVQDTDMASQVVDYTKNQILVSAATSALTYANQQPQSILKLLQ